MDIEPIPSDELAPFRGSDKNIQKDEERRFSALYNEIGSGPMLEDYFTEADKHLWTSRRPLRASRAIGLATPGTVYAAHDPLEDVFRTHDLYINTADAPASDDISLTATFGALAVGALNAVYAKRQLSNAYRAVDDLAEDLENFQQYNAVEPYEVGRFVHNRDLEDLLLDADTVRAEPRIEALHQTDREYLDTNADALAAYRDVLDTLKETHQGNVDDQTAEGVKLYGDGFLAPFLGDDEAVHRAADIGSSGVAQLLRVEETEKTPRDANPLLMSDHVFRLELVYDGKTVAKFDGTCTEDATELGEPVLEDTPRNPDFSDVMGAYREIGEKTGKTLDPDDYEISITDRGGVPRYLADTAETLGRSGYAAGRGTLKTGFGLLRSLDPRGATR